MQVAKQLHGLLPHPLSCLHSFADLSRLQPQHLTMQWTSRRCNLLETHQRGEDGELWCERSAGITKPGTNQMKETNTSKMCGALFSNWVKDPYSLNQPSDSSCALNIDHHCSEAAFASYSSCFCLQIKHNKVLRSPSLTHQNQTSQVKPTCLLLLLQLLPLVYYCLNL